MPALKLDARIGQGAYLAPGLGHRRRQSRTRSCDHRAAVAGDRHRGERHPRLHCQQSSSARLGAPGAARRGARAQGRRADRHPWPRLQGKHPFDQELALACADLDARTRRGSRSTTRSFPPRLPTIRGRERRSERARRRRGRRCACHHDAVAGLSRRSSRPISRVSMAGRTVLDPYRVLDGRAAVAAGLDYLTLGSASPSRQGISHA